MKVFDPSYQNREAGSEINGAIRRVLESNQFILGEEVEKFEEEAAEYLGTDYAVGVASGTDALILSLESIGIGEGDKVIVPNLSFWATAEAVLRVGAKPVYVDIDDTYCLDPHELYRTLACVEDIKAVIPVHHYGYPADIREIEKHGLPIIVDSAQAFGKNLPKGNINCYSFFPSKNLGCMGDGGLVATNNKDIRDRIKILRVHGQNGRWNFEHVGYNSRLDALQAAILRAKLPYLGKWNRDRRKIVSWYFKYLPESIRPPYHEDHTWSVFTISSKDRDIIASRLKAEGIESNVHYPITLGEVPAYKASCQGKNAFNLSRNCLSLPIYPGMEEHEVVEICRIIKSVTNT